MTFPDTVHAIQHRLRAVFPATPLQRNAFLSERYQADVYLKREDLTPVRSYKIRGAFTLISSILRGAEEGWLGGSNTAFVCASAGNHAQGFAYACAHFRTPGTVFMPVTTPQQKIEKTRVFGREYVTIRLIGDTFDQAYNAAREFCENETAVMVPPFDHPRIIEGQATVGAEILDARIGPVDMILMPVGGGGLSAGISEYFRSESPATRLFCVEPEGAPSLKDNLEADVRRPLPSINTFVDGASVALIGEYNFEYLRRNISEPVQLVPEDRVCSTLLEFLNHEGIVLEPAGALAVDALKNFEPAALKGKTIVCVVSGGNFDFERLPEVKERSMRYAGLKKYFILRLPQRPGALREFLDVLGPEDDIARFEYLKKSSKNFGSILLGIETSDPANFDFLFERMLERGFQMKDVTDDEVLADFII
ncbi:MAG TPA: threonine ammonia-lyase IlvA [Alphaproteobacteria bacterium]|nr:threonine ammonia-lyase IlvA [Alphaproteobacteria bacterium]